MKAKILTSTMLMLSIVGCTSTSGQVVDKTNRKAVGYVTWHQQDNINYQNIINKTVPQNATSLVFVRRMDNDPEQQSANIAINDRFQVSLHPNSYTQVYSCAGVNKISVVPTGLKTNDLLRAAKSFGLAANDTYFFYVDVNDETGNASVTQMDKKSAEKILDNKGYQAHQITRVVPNCPLEPVKPVPLPPVLEKDVSIELDVLFDTDKAVIKPAFYNEVEEVAEFMTVYSNTTAVIEGHTDSRASDAYNMTLSQKRADAVKSMLVQKFDINANRLTSIGYGESRPRATNSTKEGMQQNRRTIAVINERVRIDQNGNQILD